MGTFRRLAAAVAATLLASACAQPSSGAWPPDAARLYYPASLAAGPDGDVAYIVNTNFDQRYAGGWVTPVDLGVLAAGGTLADALSAAKPARVPSLGGRLAITGDGAHAALPHRGAGLLTLLDLDRADGGGRLAIGCGQAVAGTMPAELEAVGCAREYLVGLADAVAAPRAGEGGAQEYRDAFAAATMPGANGHDQVAVGYLGAARLTVLDVDFGARPPAVAHAGTLAGGGALTGLAGGTVGSGWLLGSARRGTVGGSKSAIYELDVAGALAAPAGAVGTVASSLAADLGGQDVAAVVASADGSRLFAASRSPDALVSLRRRAADAPWEVVGAAAADRAGLADLAFLPRRVNGASGAGDLVVAAAADQDALLFFSLAGDTPQLVRRLPLSAGRPAALLLVTVAGEPTLLATSFDGHALMRVDVRGPSAADFAEVDAFHETQF